MIISNIMRLLVRQRVRQDSLRRTAETEEKHLLTAIIAIILIVAIIVAIILIVVIVAIILIVTTAIILLVVMIAIASL